MAGRIAVDFGTSNTRIALWDESKNQSRLLNIPRISKIRIYIDENGKKTEVSCIPSLISYAGNRIWIGNQVIDQNLSESNCTFNWMKHYISCRMKLPRRIGNDQVNYLEAGADFLARVLDFAKESVDFENEEIAFTVPIEAYEHYQDWLTEVCDKAGITRFRLLDEASAAALGYGVSIQANDVYMVFDFGGGTLDVSIVKIEGDASGGKRCRVLGKAGCHIGGLTIDQWLYQDLLKRNNKTDDDVRSISALLLKEIERAKEELTTSENAEITVADPNTGAVISAKYTRTTFEDLLEKNDLFNEIQSTIDIALSKASEKGYGKDHIKSVLLVGGSSLIPCVRRTVRRIFGPKVQYHRPLDAVALGGAAFVAGVDFYDHIQHDYAIRRYNREKGDYEFKVIIEAGTPYPSTKNVYKCAVKATHNNQQFLGLDIYEVGRRQSAGCGNGKLHELVFDPNGGARFTERDDPEILTQFWVNEKNPTYIHAQPPAKKDDPRFITSFTIDGNKRLCVTVFDNDEKKHLMKDHPMVKLT